ncbi:MAG: hypothetical protein IH587_14415 [Anaerolineae bacterium]|nr:hypothetical protein [Anaerolineae bacterium]
MPDYVLANIATMEQHPFDGIAIGTHVGPKVFTRSPYPDDAFAQDRADLAAIPFTRFTDNFLVMWAGTAEQDWAFANDSDWAAAEANLRNFAATAAAGGIRGFIIDPEPYDFSAWWYNRDRYLGLEFEQAQALVRDRGTRFMSIIQEYIPDARILLLFGPSKMRSEAEARGFGLRDSPWALYGAFIEGLILGANDSTRLIDGNEGSYYYTNAQQFVDGRTYIDGAIHFLAEDPTLRERYDPVVEIGQAIYIDALLNLRDNPDNIGYHLASDEERVQLLEHNLYYALLNSDEYVWMNSENLNWWEDEVPPAVEAAIVSAREKAAAGAPLGFDVDPFVQAALADTGS